MMFPSMTAFWQLLSTSAPLSAEGMFAMAPPPGMLFFRRGPSSRSGRSGS